MSPGTAIDGFPPGVINGTVHSNDATSGQAVADLTTAYNEAAGRTLCSVTVSGNLGGQTLTPGLYTSTSSLEISSGDLTLDAQGDEDAVFIFQMASTLTTTAGLKSYSAAVLERAMSSGKLAVRRRWEPARSFKERSWQMPPLR